MISRKVYTECLQSGHLWGFISCEDLIIKFFTKNVFENIGNNYLFKTKKYCQCSSCQLQLKAYYILLHPKLKVNFCTPWNPDSEVNANCTLSFFSHNSNSVTISMSEKWITLTNSFRNGKIAYTGFKFWWLTF